VIAYHLQPPPAQREGGLDAAIRGLCGALNEAGVDVWEELPGRLERGSIVHMHGLWQRPYLAAARQCRAQGVPYVVSPHGMLEPWALRHKGWKKWPYFHLVEKRLLAGAGVVLATAEQEAERLRARLPNQRVEPIPLGLTGDAEPEYHAARARLGWLEGEKVLLFLSRLHVKKGLELLLEALEQLPTRAGLRLVVVGQGEAGYVEGLQKRASGRAAHLPKIDWVGPVWGEGRWAYFQGADLFCLPSYSENFGLAVLEALQVGTPVLTTHTTPWGAALAEPSGFICNPEVASVAAALRRALGGPAIADLDRQALAAWTREHYGWKHLAERYKELYESLIPH
jgi:glycosyltransferase involved in cell wall biosynthesis